MDTDFHTITDLAGNVLNPNKPIFIGDHVWIGCRNTILKGASIPNDCVLAANSIITNKLNSSHCIYGTNGVILKRNIDWMK